MKKWSGRSASVSVAGTLYHFKSWELEVERSRIDVTDMLSAAWREFLTGFRSGTINLSGPLDTDSALIDEDDPVVIVLGIGGGNQVSCPAVIIKNNMKQDTDDAARYAVSAAVTGQPTFTLGV